MPRTNVFWLHFILIRLLESVDLRKPALRGRNRASDDDIANYKIIERLEKEINPCTKRGKNFAKRWIPESAADVVQWAEAEGLFWTLR